MWEIVLVVAAGAMVAGLVQGISGFAFGMTAMSIWAWFLDPQMAAALAVFGAWTGQMIAAFTLRRQFGWAVLKPYLLGGLCGIPLGTYLLPYLNVPAFQALLGSILLLWCPAMLYSRFLPVVRRRSHAIDALVGGAGGIMGGLGGFTGVLPTLWCTLQAMPRDEQRSIIQNFNLSVLSVTMLVYLASGKFTLEILPYCGIVAAAVFVPVVLGGRIYVGLSEQQFRQVVLSLLTLSGVALLSASVPVLWAQWAA